MEAQERLKTSIEKMESSLSEEVLNVKSDKYLKT